MTVLFRESLESKKFLSVWNKSKTKNSGLALQDMNSKGYGSKVLGYALADAGTTDFEIRYNREFFSDNYDKIIDSHETLGTYNTLLFLIKAALGENTEITFSTPEPAYLIININEASVKSKFKTKSGDLIQAKLVGGIREQLFFKSTTSIYTLNQVSTMLKSIEAAGVYVEYNFIKGS